MKNKLAIPRYQICFHVCSHCHEVVEITIRDGKESHRGHANGCLNETQTECFETKEPIRGA